MIFFFDEGEDEFDFLEVFQNRKSFGRDRVNFLVLVELFDHETLLNEEVKSFLQYGRVDVGFVHDVGEFKRAVDECLEDVEIDLEP